MSMGTAMSIGMGLIQHRQEIGAALSSLSKLSGSGFSKIAQDFHLPKGLSQPISTALNTRHALQAGSASSSNTLQVLAGLHAFDANRDGALTQTELTQGLSHLKSTGQTSTEKGAGLYHLGEQMLNSYAKVAQLDGSTNSISLEDTLKLAQRDGKVATLSTQDWQSLNA